MGNFWRFDMAKKGTSKDVRFYRVAVSNRECDYIESMLERHQCLLQYTMQLALAAALNESHKGLDTEGSDDQSH